MSIPIYEDEIIRDQDGTIRLKKDGTVLEKNGHWVARNYYLTTREDTKNIYDAQQRYEHSLDSKQNKKDKADKLKSGTKKVGWLARMRAMFRGDSSHSK